MIRPWERWWPVAGYAIIVLLFAWATYVEVRHHTFAGAGWFATFFLFLLFRHVRRIRRVSR